MEWLKAYKWYILAGLVALAVIFGGDIVPVDFIEGNK